MEADLTTSEGVEERRDRRHAGRGDPSTLEVVDKIACHLTVKVGDEHPRRRPLPPRRQPGNRLLVGRDRIARALRREHDLDPDCRVGRIPEDNAEDLLQHAIRFLAIVRRCQQRPGQRRKSSRHLGRLDRRPQVHPASRHLPAVEQRPAGLSAGGERAGVEGIAAIRRYVARHAHGRQPHGDPRLDDPRIEEGVPALPLSERRSERVEHGVDARRFAGVDEVVEAAGISGHRVTSRWRIVS